MTVPVRLLASYDESACCWLAEAGTYIFDIGASSRDIRANLSLKLEKYTESTDNVLLPKGKINIMKKTNK